jgi:hypothetical protein
MKKKIPGWTILKRSIIEKKQKKHLHTVMQKIVLNASKSVIISADVEAGRQTG